MRLGRGLGQSPGFVVGASLLGATLLLGFAMPWLLGSDATTRVGLAFMPPSAEHWLGTDHMGIDMLARLLAGLRSSLGVGLVAGVVATLVGTVVGVYGGFRGGRVDDVLTVATNLFLVVPSLVVLILLGQGAERGRSWVVIAVAIGTTSWTWSARALRAQSSTLRERDHVSLARMSGYGTLGILAVHVLPYLFSYIFMVFILQTATGILAEASISMLGLGPYDAISLGRILDDAVRNEALTDGAWWAFVPAMALVTLIAFALFIVNTAMEGVFNPRLGARP